MKYCLQEAEIGPDQIDYIGYYEKPMLKFERLLETYLAFAPAGFQSFRSALPLWIDQKLYLDREIRRGVGTMNGRRIVYVEHHESHAASAFFPSPFDEAAIITMDGVGEWATATYGHGQTNQVKVTHEIRFPHSLGLLYSAFTYYTGFEVNSGEYKLMGLAPYGRPRFRQQILDHLIDVKSDGSFWMDMSYFNYCQGLTMTSEKFHRLFGDQPRRPDEWINQKHMDLARSVQVVTEEIMLNAANHVHRETGSKNLCLAGGVALNCVANGRILREGPFDNIWIQPAAGDAGGALGTAVFIWHQLLGKPRRPPTRDAQRGSLLGPSFETAEICSFLDSVNAPYQVHEEKELLDRVVGLMVEGKVIGWFQGRSEFGPRALGCRSIIGDARNQEMQTIMNVKVKFRESFRPFAPCVLTEHVHEYFEMRKKEDSPYMLMVAPVREELRHQLTAEQKQLTGIDLLKVSRSKIPAITHVDYSARVQTVDEERHGRYYRLMRRFHEVTGSPVIVNTSFNLSWEPIVNRPEEAYRTFMSSDIDALVLEDVVLVKEQQPPLLEAVTRTRNGGWKDPALEQLLACPSCGSQLTVEDGRAECRQCSHTFIREEGIWRMFWDHETNQGDVPGRIKSFYREHPFPNYDDRKSVRSLITKSRDDRYSRLLGDQMPFNSRVLEVGCGTGQLSNFLAVGCRTVVGTDQCLNSLRLAERFRSQQELTRVRFMQMNLLRPALRPDQFDVVLYHSLLRHPDDLHEGFKNISKLVKPGGHILVGLHNKFSRLVLGARRLFSGSAGGTHHSIDRGHSHRSGHTVGEVLKWFDDSGFSFVNAIPKTRPQDTFMDNESLFEVSPRGTPMDHILAQATSALTGSGEKGFQIMIGRKEARQ